MHRRAISILLFAAAAAAGARTMPATAAGPTVLPWIDDDYARALSEARAKKVPIFAELWAPWCHTCRSMRAFVFTDKALAKYAGQFVWLSIDTEKAQNADFVKRYPIRAWPSFYVIDPAQGVDLLALGGRRDGRAAREALRRRARRRAGARASPGPGALYAEGNYAEAAKAYAQALEGMTPKSPQYARAVEARLFCLQTTKIPSECVALARAAMPHLRATASGANVAGVRPRLRPRPSRPGPGSRRDGRRLRGGRLLGARGQGTRPGRRRPVRALRLALHGARRGEGRGRGPKGRARMGRVPRRRSGAQRRRPSSGPPSTPTA